MSNNITEEEIMIKEKYFVNQTSVNDCGAACLAMIFKLNNINISLNRIKRDLKIESDGISAYEIIKYASKKGIKAEGYKSVNINDLTGPSIIHTINPDGTQHFVVFLKRKKDKILIADPAKRIMYVDKKEFIKKYTGIAIIFDRKENFFNEVFKNKIIIIKILIISVLLIIISIIFSCLLPILINLLETNGNIYPCIFGFVIVILLKNVVSYLKEKILIRFQLYIDKVITIPVLRKFIFLPQDYYQDKGSGELVSKASDLFYVKNAIYVFVSNIIINILFLLFCLIIIFFLDKAILVLNILFITIILLVNKSFFSNNLSKAYDMQLASENLNNKLTSYFNLIDAIKNLSKETYLEKKIKNIYNNVLSKSEDINNIYNKKTLKDNLFFELFNLLIIVIVIFDIRKVSMILFVISVQNIIMDIIKEIIKDLPIYIDFKSYYKRINEVIKIKSERKTESSISVKRIHVNKLNYKYDGKFILKDINIEINKNDWIMIKGPTGSGKSTLFKLISGKLHIKNYITFNNVNINELGTDIIKNSIIYIDQKTKLFNMSIKENIFFDKPVNEKVLKTCLIDKMLSNKNITLDYIINNSNSNFSGGEISKILIAQALNLNKSVLILDETTNNFDYETEKQILTNIKRNYNDLILILITHRDKNSDFFNKIYALEKGKIKIIKEVK